MIHTGVLQGSVILSALFNAYISDLFPPPADVKLVSYADDITVYTSGPTIPPLTDKLNGYLEQLSTFLSDRSLTLSTSKSTVTLFSPNTHEARYHPQVKINGSVLPLERRPKILGIIFDIMLTFANHAKTVASKVSKPNSILRALSGTSWGQNKETIINTYKAISRSVINYAALVWTPILKPSHFDRLRRAQHAALRTATSCHRIASFDHLHQETKALPVKIHNRLLCDQYLASCLSAAHPCHYLTVYRQPPRLMKNNIQTFSHRHVYQVRNALPIDATSKHLTKALHAAVVKEALNSYEVNRVLQRHPPAIATEEQTLGRKTRCRLSQLR